MGGFKPDGDTPRADRPKQLQNGFQAGYGSICLVKPIARKSILPLVRNGKNFSLLFPAICRRSEIAGTELAALADLLGRKPLGILQHSLKRFRLLLSPADIESTQFDSAQQHVEQRLEVRLPFLLYPNGNQRAQFPPAAFPFRLPTSPHSGSRPAYGTQT